MLETFTAKMTALADAVRSKFGLTGSLTVADMVTAVSGEPYSSAGATLAGWDTDMHALGDAIRAEVGGTAELTVDDIAAAVGSISPTYTSCVDPSLIDDIDLGGHSYEDYNINRITMVLPAGTYSDFVIEGVQREPSSIHFNANTTGSGGRNAAFTYDSHSDTIHITESVPGGIFSMFFTDYYRAYLDMSPVGNATPGFSFPYEIWIAEAWSTAARQHKITSEDCLLLSFKYTPPAAMLMMSPRNSGDDEITPELEAEYLAYWEALKAEAAMQKESGGEDA